VKWRTAKNLSSDKFRRLTGVKIKTFKTMVEILTQAKTIKKKKGGRPNKLIIEDMMLITLEYLREYRTYFHVDQSFGISESAA